MPRSKFWAMPVHRHAELRAAQWLPGVPSGMAKTGIAGAALAQLLCRYSCRNPALGCFGNAATGDVPDVAR
jgi:hypothetical protein